MASLATGLRTVQLKAELLTHGVMPTPVFLRHYGPPYLEKRRAYGNPDATRFLATSLPQELYLGPERLVCSVAVREASPWLLDWSEARQFHVCRRGANQTHNVGFPRRPRFYDRNLPDGTPANSIITLYGGGSLGIFVYGHCALVDENRACHYCSIAPNRLRTTDFPMVVQSANLAQALRIALNEADLPISQVMINGGNFADPDKSFGYYAQLAAVARAELDAAGRTDVELHLIVFPPQDVQRIQSLQGLDVHLAMNWEVHDDTLFARYCPGKVAIGGHRTLGAGLDAAVDVLGPGRVYSLLVGGLEPRSSLVCGLKHLAERGVIPVINVFHADPGTPLASHPAPTAQDIMTMGRDLQHLYQNLDFARPFYAGCGRNSLDAEAYACLF